MTQTQLLALDTILPTVLGLVGLVFLAAAIWPVAAPERPYAARSVVLGVVGIACVGIGVWLWLTVLRAASQLVVQELPPPGGTSSITTAQRPSVQASPSGTAGTPAPSAASPKPTAIASLSAPALPTEAPTVAPTLAPTPAIPANLTPVPASAFQPETTQPHAAIIGVESFEHGSMLYRDDVKQIYVMSLDSKFKVYPDRWVEGRDPDLGSSIPIAAKFYPRRGFGWLWASDPDVRQTLGLGLTAEQGFTGSIIGDGNATTIRADMTYVFNKDGTWALK